MNSGFILKLILIATLLLLLPALPAFAATINVDSGCTLAQAINEANGAAKPEGVTCEEGNDTSGSTDTIVIPSNFAGTGKITLSSPLPTLTSHIIINGNSNVLSGGDSTHLFVTGSGAHVTLRRLSLRQGHSDDGAAAIDHKAGSLVLENVFVSNNGVDRDDTGSAGAGAILSSSALTISGSVFHGNSGYKDSGDVPASIKHTAGNLTIDSTVFRAGAGSYEISAAVTGTATVTIRNSTFFGTDTQTNPSVLIKGAGVTSYVHHITSQDGIAFGAGTHHLRNSIIYDDSSECVLVDSGSLTSNSNNIIETNNCGGSPSNADPLLPERQIGQGTVPRFLALPPNSPAVDAAGDCTAYTTTSHNGVTRPSPAGGACDIGAFELEQAQPPPVACFTFRVDDDNSLKYYFDASVCSEGHNINSYGWTFSDGDNTPNSGNQVSYTFATAGQYTVRLTVQDSYGGRDSTEQIISVQAPLTAAIAGFSYEATGSRVVFKSTSTGSNLEYSWDVDGDGNEDYNVANFAHTYSSPGTYTVTLTASNAKPSSDTASQEVVVSFAAPPRSGGTGAPAAGSSPAAAPEQVDSTCESLPENVEVKPMTESTECQLVRDHQISDPAVAAEAIAAVDVWSWVLPDTKVCFQGQSGSIRFIDTGVLPRRTMDKQVFSDGGMICTMIDGPGIVALAPGPPAPTPVPAQEPAAVSLPAAPPASAPACTVDAQSNPPRDDGSLIHIVQPGDCLWSIANAYSLTFGELVRLNGLDWNNSMPPIQPGQEIIVGAASE